MAFKVEEQAGKPVLTPAWNSLNMSVPTPVIIANGVVFALSDGDSGVQFGPSGNLLSVEDRKAKTGHAIVYALDASTGNVLYSTRILSAVSRISARLPWAEAGFMSAPRTACCMHLDWVSRNPESRALS